MGNKFYSLVIPGRPATKKNSSRYIPKIHRLIPSKAYQNYEKIAVKALREQYKEEPIDNPVIVTARYIMDNRRAWPDLVGLMQATGDILQRAGVIADDRYIVDWSGTMIYDVDPENPKCLITLQPIPLNEHYESYWTLDPKLLKRYEEYVNGN